jgi:hypothetical protein
MQENPGRDSQAIEDADDAAPAREALRHLDDPTASMAELLADLFGAAGR